MFSSVSQRLLKSSFDLTGLLQELLAMMQSSENTYTVVQSGVVDGSLTLGLAHPQKTTRPKTKTFLNIENPFLIQSYIQNIFSQELY
jgi:hypothetical protein